MKKSAFKILLSLLLVVVTIFSLSLALVACNDNAKFSELKGQSDRTILFIGDGMGDNHIKVTEAYMDKQLFFDDFGDRAMLSQVALMSFKQPTARLPQAQWQQV